MRSVLSVVFFALSLVSCVMSDYEGMDPNQPKRTVVVYLGGDNSISSELRQEVEALRQGWSYTGNRCVIYIDPVDDVPCLLSLRGGCKVTPTPYIDTLAVYSEENSASAAVLKRVIDDAVRRYPADSYGLIFASHGSGWLPEGTLANPTRTIGQDEDPGSSQAQNQEMEIADMAAAIEEGQFDFILFEACLMAGVEVAYELRNKTDYLLVSSAELLSPGFVPIYPKSFVDLMRTANNPSIEQALSDFASSYMRYINTQSGAYRSATLSIIKTEKLEALAAQTRQLFQIAPSETSDLASLQHFDRPGSYGDLPARPRYFDYMERMEQIASPEQYVQLEALMSQIVVWKENTSQFLVGYNGFTIARHAGMTIYIQQDDFPKLNDSYRQTAWYKATN